MAASNINRVTLTGNLTRDPELRSTPAGAPVCSLRLATSTRRRDAAGEWFDKPNYFDVTAFGTTAENCATYLRKGRPIAVDGRLEWREWEDAEGHRRQAVEVVADRVQFLGTRDHGDDRWWMLAPTLLVQRDDGEIGFASIGHALGGRPLGRALMSGEPRRILDALGARRCAIALHVDIERDGELFAAIVAMVLTALTSSIQYARVERSDAGTPRLAPWEVGGIDDAEVFGAVERALERES